MNSKEVKAIRGQIRQIVKEILPEILKQELQNELYKGLQQEIAGKLTAVASQVHTQLELMDQRSKDVQSFLMREIVNQTRSPSTEQVTPPSVSTENTNIQPV